jgi:hypothetical protein
MVIYGANYFFRIAGAELRIVCLIVLSTRKVALYVESTLNNGCGVKQIANLTDIAAGKATADKAWSRCYKTLQVRVTKLYTARNSY